MLSVKYARATITVVIVNCQSNDRIIPAGMPPMNSKGNTVKRASRVNPLNTDDGYPPKESKDMCIKCSSLISLPIQNVTEAARICVPKMMNIPQMLKKRTQSQLAEGMNITMSDRDIIMCPNAPGPLRLTNRCKISFIGNVR